MGENVPVKASGCPIIAEPGKKVGVEIRLEDDEGNNSVVTISVKVKKRSKKGVAKTLSKAVDGMRLNEVRSVTLSAKNARKYKLPKANNYRVELVEVKQTLPDIELKVDMSVSAAECKGSILFMHGWPDDETVFAPQRAFCLENGYKCMYYTLPWFGPKKEAFATAKARKFKSYGYGHTQLVDAIANKAYQEVGEGNTFFVVAHDWGAYQSQLLRVRHPHLVEKTVQVDVENFEGAHFPTSKNVPTFIILGFIYMYMLVWSHYLSQLNFPPFSSLANAMSRNRVKSLKKLKNKEIKVDAGCARQNYVYTKYRADVFRRLIGVKGSGTEFCVAGSTVKTDNTSGLYERTLFVYGEEKAFMFHSGKFAKRLNSDAEEAVTSAAVGVKAGHWVSLDAPDELNDLIISYFEKSEELCAEIKQNSRKEKAKKAK